MKRSLINGSARTYVCPELIGRVDAITALHHVIERTAAGESRAALVTGDAGVGKSRLLATARAYAVEHGFDLVEGACFPQDRAEPFAPLVDALRVLLAGLTPEEITAACGPFAHDLQPLLPDLLVLPAGARTTAPAEQQRRRLFAALAYCLIDHAARAPLLLILEDLHWCDEATLDFLFHIVRRTPSRPLLLLGAYRADELTPARRAWLAQMARDGLAEEIALSPLNRDEVRAMTRAIAGPDTAVPAVVIDALDNIAEGNPFYVEELLTSLIATNGPAALDSALITSHDPGPRLPDSLCAAVQGRVERLTLATREILQLAAVIGRRFDFELLSRLTRRDEHELLALLEELVAARLVTEESGDRFAFRHALTRHVVYSDLLIRARVMLHRRAGEAAEQLYAPAIDQHLGDLAEHFSRAEMWDKAQSYARRAGTRALELCAWQTAAEQFTRALEANRRTGDTPLDHTAAAAHRGRGRAFSLMGDFARAWADYEAALAGAHTAGDTREACLGLLDAGVLWASRDNTRAGEYYRQALALARQLDEPTLLAECLNRVANWHSNVAEPWEAAPLLREALAIAERGDRRGLAVTLDWLGTATYLSRDLAGSTGYFERAAAVFRELDDRPLLASCLTMLATRAGSLDLLSLEAGAADVATGIRDGEEALALARAIDSPTAEAFALIQLAVITGPRGDYRRALELAERALQIAEAIGHRYWMTVALCALGGLYLDLLDPTAARRHLERARALARELSMAYWVRQATGRLALAHLHLHEPDRAVAVLAELPHTERPGAPVGQWWDTYAHARLALTRRDAALALRMCDQMRGPAGADGRRPYDTPLLIRLRAEALTALGQIDTAAAEFQVVREAMRRQGTLSELWRIHASLGDLYRRSGRAEDARREFTAARALIEQLAANIPDARLRDRFLERATALLPRAYRLSPASTATARYGGLSARERDVATLIAGGKSNGEIARALVLGKRTIETHVANILTKLDAASRREIAAWATTHGLTADVSGRAA